MSARWDNQQWKDSMKVKYDYTNLMVESIGEKHGISEKEIESTLPRVDKAISELINLRDKGNLGFYNLPYNLGLTDEITHFAQEAKNKYENFVVLGIGGSALGCIALHTALNSPQYNLLPRHKRNNSPRMFFVDNIDPDLISALLDIIDVRKTLFNVITKSGGTAETMANFLVFYDMLKKSTGENCHEHMIATTSSDKGALLKIAKQEHFKLLYIPENVGGRFSVFSPVGLLSATISGIDIKELLAGARYMDEICQNNDIGKNPAYMNAVCHYILHTYKGKNIHVMMPYSNKLKDVADWFRQLWAESLGKKHDLEGNIVHVGPTPVKALGATDQHSQIQLYVEGPNDKIITFLTVENFETSINMPDIFPHIEATSYFTSHTLNELIKNEQLSTELALMKNERPNCKFCLPAVNSFTLGQLLFLLEVQTALAGQLYHVNAFDQPGVEEGKIATYALMGRSGYETKYQEIRNLITSSSPRFI